MKPCSTAYPMSHDGALVRAVPPPSHPPMARLTPSLHPQARPWRQRARWHRRLWRPTTGTGMGMSRRGPQTSTLRTRTWSPPVSSRTMGMCRGPWSHALTNTPSRRASRSVLIRSSIPRAPSYAFNVAGVKDEGRVITGASICVVVDFEHHLT
jgi:hypothetical protein